VEDQATANERIPVLLKTPAAKRFVSLEPMIEKVNILPYIGGRAYKCKCGWHETEYGLHLYGAKARCFVCHEDCESYDGISSVILGGESGPKARPLDPAWVRLVRDQCEAAGVPFMFKQSSGRNSDHWRQYCDGHSLLSDGFPVLDGRIHRALAWEAKHAA